MKFEWDPSKDRTNQARHGLSFEQARELLSSETDCLEIYDEAHSDREDRFIAVGPISEGVVLVVWTERQEGTIRIISARWATARETDMYYRHLGMQR